MSNQSLRQQSVRDVTGTALSYEGDWHALFDDAGIAAGPFNGRLLAWINDRLGASWADLPGAMQAFAEDQGFNNWSSMGTFDASGDAAFSPVSLFGSGEQGAVYDPSDLSTLWQDTAGTTPVTATGQLVARIDDKSGRGNNATQPTASARPTLQQDGGGRYYLNYDGVDDHLVTSTINFASRYMTVCVGVYKTSDAAAGMLAELSPNLNVNPGSFYLAAPPTAGQAAIAWAPYGGGSVATVTATGVAAGAPYVVTGLGDVVGNISIIRVNGSQAASSAAAQGGTNFGNYPIYIGRRGSSTLYYNGRLYSAVFRGATTDASSLSSLETWTGSKSGVTL